MADVIYNLIRFVADDGVILPMTLEGTFRITPGLKPNVNAFSVPWDVFDLLEGRYERRGRIEFWSSRKPGDDPSNDVPDVAWDKMRLVDIEAIEDKYTLLSVHRITKYRLHFADFRESLLSPRGGILRTGKINAKGTEAADLISNRQLIELCLGAMGFDESEYSIIGDPNARAQIYDLEWRGNHAPGELEKILADLWYVFCPRSDGMIWISPMGEGDLPEGNQWSAAMDLPGIERRGKTIVFSSYPNQMVRTKWITGPSVDTWSFVLVGLAGQIHDISDLGYGGAKAIVRRGFTLLPASIAERIRQCLYRYVRLSKSKYPVTVQKVVQTKDGEALPIAVKAMRAIKNDYGLYENSEDYVEGMAAHLMKEGDSWIIDLGQRIGRVDESASGVVAEDSWEHYFVPLEDGQLEIQVSYGAIKLDEAGNPILDANGKTIPEYFEVGYKLDANGGVVKLSDGELATALVDRETLVIPRPSWVAHIVENGEDDRSKIEDLAILEAKLWLTGSGNAKMMRGVGFAAAELNGAVASIEITQGKPQTTIKANTWMFPASAITAERWKEGGGLERFPGQVATASARAMAGSGGADQAVATVWPGAGGSAAGGGGGGVIPVLLSNPSGYDGADLLGGDISLVYDLYAMDGGTLLASDIAPVGNRWHGLWVKHAGVGVAVVVSGVYVLLLTDEMPYTGDC